VFLGLVFLSPFYHRVRNKSHTCSHYCSAHHACFRSNSILGVDLGRVFSQKRPPKPPNTPTHENLSLQIKEKILCLEIMGVDFGRALSQNPSLHAATLESIHSLVSFLQSKAILQKDLPGMREHRVRRIRRKGKEKE
jgi:hypothetical protein